MHFFGSAKLNRDAYATPTSVLMASVSCRCTVGYDARRLRSANLARDAIRIYESEQRQCSQTTLPRQTSAPACAHPLACLHTSFVHTTVAALDIQPLIINPT